ncbi:HAMP domain-containing histidine kinase [Erysipelothrix sp. HDW6C]|uniref:sensor histidine kinase n=1 Tax=Erysipelothrix sp. HDW6C TaxID=2714930 RepID=UPI001409CE99|nr:HAMP domain-containing sensor histidine kinase [Erysipelothrix sp. HDW6C]QIK70801.1 HAMP domain-containing histidine kinase [Erysipelothrix sp. HDW6C]
MIRDKEIRAITEQIMKVTDHETFQPILTDSINKTVMELCNQLNHNFSMQKRQLAAYYDTQDSYRKMLSNISHDLKTPLTVVKGMLELVDLEHRDRETNQQYLHKIEEKVNDVIHMIHDFFDLNKLESNDTPMLLEPLDLSELSRKVILTHYDAIDQKQLTLDIDVPDHPVLVNANQQALERVLDNLITNAIQYGSDGKVIGLRIKHVAHRVEMMIWDRGKGIEALNQSHVFERLFTLEDSRSKDYSGSGLGLTITKRLVESMNGTISLESVPYHYTEFKITLNQS